MDIRNGKIHDMETVKDKFSEKEIKNYIRGIKTELTEKQQKTGKIGRNDTCPCGSGKKFKKCCLFKNNKGE